MTEQNHRAGSPKTYPAEAARQGSIILRTRAHRAIFIAGLVGIVVLALFFAIMAWGARDSAQLALEEEMPALAHRDIGQN